MSDIGIFIGTTEPGGPVEGQTIWLDPSANTIKFWDGADWLICGPAGVDLKTDADATGMRIATGDGGTSGVIVQPNDTDDCYGQVAVAPKGTPTHTPGTSNAIAGIRIFADDPQEYGDVSDHEAFCIESHHDADDTIRYRLCTRAQGTGKVHRPIYIQVGGANGPLIHTNGLLVTCPKSGPGYWDWPSSSYGTPGDLVMGRNTNFLKVSTYDGTGAYRIIGGNTANEIRLDPDGYGIRLGAGSGKIISAPYGNLNGINIGTYTPGDTSPSVGNYVTYMEIANSGTISITAFDDGTTGQVLTLLFADSNTTITRDSCYLAGGSTFTGSANDVLVLVKAADGAWREVSRQTTAS